MLFIGSMHLRHLGFDATHINVYALSNSTNSARQIRDAVMTISAPKRVRRASY